MKDAIAETTVSFLAPLSEAERDALLALRAAIRKAAPEAEEYVGYGIPAFRQDGALVSFGAARKHLAFYVQSPKVMEAFAAELTGFETSKGAIRFTPDRPIPEALVGRLVAARLAENAAARGRTKKR